MTGTLGFEEDIRVIVDEADRKCMASVPRGSFDLWNWAQVQPRARLILRHLRGEDGLMRMPPAGWPDDKIQRFEAWVREGAPKRRASAYADFFRAIDAQTEYFDVYGSLDGLPNMEPFYDAFFGPDLLQGVWLRYMQVAPRTPVLKQQKRKLWDQVLEAITRPTVLEGLLGIDAWLCGLVESHFGSGESLDVHALFDAFSAFGRDALPTDEDRVRRVQALGKPGDRRLVEGFARYHRMDSRSMWFFWFGHLHCVFTALEGQDDPRREVRSALLAAIFVGQTFDTAFRTGSEGPTRPAYEGAEGAGTILATAEVLRDDPGTAIVEMEELFLIWSRRIPPT
jgi:hypothetical protein